MWVEKCLMRRLVKGRLEWVGHVERMREDCLPMKACGHREIGRRRKGRPHFQEGICRRKTEVEEGDWMTMTLAKDRRHWMEVVKMEVCIYLTH